MVMKFQVQLKAREFVDQFHECWILKTTLLLGVSYKVLYHLIKETTTLKSTLCQNAHVSDKLWPYRK
jgi:hypothetical protein